MLLQGRWKFALFFDLHPERILDVDAMERSLGRLYRRLTFQALYDAFESEAGLSKLIAAGWFPFIETIGGEFEELLNKSDSHARSVIDSHVKEHLRGESLPIR